MGQVNILEDTPCSPKLIQFLFNSEILDGIQAISKKKNETKDDYYRRVKNNDLAKVIKYYDMTHNLDITRFTNPTQEQYVKCEYYKKTRKIFLD